MFLSNWLVFKIVLAAVTGLVDYPLAADVLLVYDNANKLYLDGNSIDYVSNVVLYKGETSYTLGMGDIINKTTTTAYEVALPANSVHATFGINQDATRYVHQYPVADGYQNGKFQVYSGTPSGGYTEYGSPITPFNGDEIINCAMSADGKYILVTTWNGGNDGYKMYKDNGSEYVYHSSYSFIGSKTTTGYNPAFVPSNNNFVITGTDDSSTWHFKLYVYNSATETWTAKVQVTPLGGSSSNYQRGSTGKGFTYDGNYFFQSSNGTTTRGEVWSVDWDANTMTYKWHTTEGSDGDGAGGAISPDNRYVVLCKHTGNPYRVYENMSGDWTTVENVTSQFDLTGSGTSTSFGSYGVGFSGYSSENTTPLYIGQAAGLYGDGKFRIENWAKRSPYEMYITQPGTYRAELQICGIDYKTNTVEVTGTPTSSKVTQISTGDDASGVLTQDGFVYMWGLDNNGTLGQGTDGVPKNTPVKVKGVGGTGYLGNIIKITRASYATLALASDGTLYAWGNNDYGIIGNGTSGQGNHPLTPVEVSYSGDPISKISGGRLHAGLVTTTGKVYCWGQGTNGQIGDNQSASNRTVPTQVVGVNNIGNLTGIRDITCGDSFTHAIKDSDGSVYAWGKNTYGMLGDGTTTDRTTPVPVILASDSSAVTGIIQISSGGDFALFLKSDGTVYSCGYGASGQLGDGGTANNDTGLVQVLGVGGSGYLTGITQIATCDSTSLALKSDGTMYVWGNNVDGQNGLGTVGGTNPTTPVAITTLTGVNAIAGEGRPNHFIASKPDGSVYCWGRGASGQIGDGTNTADQGTPTQVIAGAGPSVDGKFNLFTEPRLTFDNYNKFSILHGLSYTSSKLAYYSNVYDVGTLTDKLYIENPGDYTSLTFDTSSNVAYFSNATVGAIASTQAGYGADTIIYGTVQSGASHGNSQGGFGNNTILNADGTRLLVTDPLNYPSGRGRAYIYHLESGSWVLKQTWDNPTNSGQRFADGACMNEDGTRVFLMHSTSEKVYTYEYASGAWPTANTGTHTISPGTIGSLSLNLSCNKTGDVLLIVHGRSQTSKIYRRASATSWSQDSGGSFSSMGDGGCINGDGTRAFLGRESDSTIHMTEWNGSTWSSLTQIINESDTTFPAAMACDSAGDTLVVKAAVVADIDKSGIYERDSGTGSWSRTQDINGSTEIYGTTQPSISYDGTMLLVGSHHYDSSKGRAYLWQKSGGSWSLTKTYENPDASPASNDYWGSGTGIARTSKGTFVIGFQSDDTAGTDYGSVHIYTNAIPDFISFDTYNKLSLSGITNPTSKIHALPTGAESTTTYDIGSATNIYIESAGTYTAEMKGSDAFALDSTVVGTVYYSDIQSPYFTDASTIVTDSNWSSSTGFEITASAYEASQPGYHAFDNTYTAANSWESTWLSGSSMPQWLQIQYPQDVVIKSYTIVGRDATDRYIPTSWQLQGATAAAPSTYVNLETTSGNRTASSWAPLAEVSYDVNSSNTAYRYFRLYVNSSNENNQVSINELKLFTTPLSGQIGVISTPQLTFDGFNKYTFTGADTGSTYKLKYFSNTYDLGTISNVYIANPGTYSAEIKGATNFALSSNVVNTVYYNDIQNPYFTSATNIVSNSDWTSSGWEITASSVGASQPGYQAFDNIYTAANSYESTWLSAASSGMPAWLKIKYPYDVIIKSYTIVGRDDTDRYYPTSWQLQGSTDDLTYVNLETTGSNRTASGWAPLAEVSYNVNTPGTAYRYFRLYVNSSNEGGQVSINELKLFTTNTPSLTHDGYNKLTFTGLESGSTSNVTFDGNTYSIGTASNVYISEQGTYDAESKGTTTFALTSNVVGTMNTPFTAAFHHGAFSASDYSSAYSTVGAAATAGFVYSDTTPATYTWGTLNSVDTSTTGQTGYSWTPTSDITADVLMAAGGGGGGGANAGGGGAGGLVYNSGISLTGAKTIVVGAGGTKGQNWSASGTNATKGNDTTFTDLDTAIGGGAGQTYVNDPDIGSNDNGGSGGGGGASSYTSSYVDGGTGTSGQGNAGGRGIRYAGGGGGGAGGSGSDGVSPQTGGAGGIGLNYTTTFGATYGDSGWFAGGGGAGQGSGQGGQGGGGDGGNSSGSAGTNGQNHTGGGGGGCGSGTVGGDGGSGIVIIRSGPSAPPSLTHDGYKLVVSGITPTSTTLNYGSNTYETGSATNIYVENTGAYTAEIGNATDFVFTSNTVSGTIKTIEPALVGGNAHLHALAYDGKLYAWGINDDGELGLGDNTNKTTPTLYSGPLVSKILNKGWSGGNTRNETSWIKTVGNEVYATGKGDTYMIPGTSSDLLSFTDVTSYFGDQSLTSNNVVFVGGGERSCVALTESGNVWTWGTHDSAFWNLGQGTSASSSNTPKQITFGGVTDNISRVAFGHDHGVALDTDGDVWFWGQIWAGGASVDYPQTTLSDAQKSPHEIMTSNNIIGVSSTFFTIYAWQSDGTYYALGQDSHGQIGDGATSGGYTSWQKIEYFSANNITINEIYTGQYNVFADTSDGYYCWGYGASGAFGNGGTGNLASPTKWTNVSNIKLFSAGGSYMGAAITEDGKYYAWGSGSQTQRGDNDTGNISYPKYIDTLPNILAPSFEFDGYDKVLAHMKPTSYVYEFFISVKLDGGSLNEWHSYGITTTSGTLTQSMLQIHPTISSGALSDMFNGSYTSGTLLRIADGNHEVGTKIMTLTSPFELADITFYVYRPYYQPGYKIVLNGNIILNETTNAGSAQSPSPTSFTKTLPPMSSSLTKYTKDTHTYDANQAQIVTVSDPGTYDAQIKSGTDFNLKSATVPATSSTGLYTWAFHHGNFDNAYGDGDILTARENGRFYADTPSYTGDIGTITCGDTVTQDWTSNTVTMGNYTLGIPIFGRNHVQKGILLEFPNLVSEVPNSGNNGFNLYIRKYTGSGGDQYHNIQVGAVSGNAGAGNIYIYPGSLFGSFSNFEYIKVWLTSGNIVTREVKFYGTSAVTSTWTEYNDTQSWQIEFKNFQGTTTDFTYRYKYLDNTGQVTSDLNYGGTLNTTYTFTPASTLTANVLMVAGGGGGGGRYHAGGGGAGGLVYTAGTSLAQGATKTIVVGNGDSGGNADTGGNDQNGFNGKNTSFTDLDTAIGGGGGGRNYTAGNSGGSGGGGGASQTLNTPNAGGSGTGSQGNDGGVGIYSGGTDRSGGGGGGAGGVGIPGVSSSVSGEGGIGKFFGTGSSYTDFGDEYGEGGYFAGGGGGGVYHTGIPGGIPGRGGGGYGATEYGYMGVGGSQHALPHTGGGGGGSGMGETTDQHPGYNSGGVGGVLGHGGRGGSGIVLIQTNVALPNGANTAVVQVGNPRRRSLPPAVSGTGSEVNRFYIIDSASTPTYNLPTHWYTDPVGRASNSVWTTQGSHSLQKRADGGTSNVFYVTSTEGIFEYGSYMAQSADAIFMPVEAQRYNGLLAIGSNSTNDIHFEMAADGTAALYYDNGATLLSAGTITCFTVGKWHHIALTVDSGGNAVGYVNGYPVVSGTHTSVAAVGSRSGNMHMRVGDHSITFRKFLTYEVSTYNFHMSPKQVLQRAAEVGLGPKLEYDGLNAINVVNIEKDSEITIYESNVNDTSNLYVVACNTSSYLLSNAGTYYAQIKGTDTFTITRPLTVTDDHFPLYQYPPIDGTTSSLTSSTTNATWTISGEQYSTESSVAGTPYNTFDNSITSGFDSTSSTGDITITFESSKTIRKYIVWPYDSTAPVSTPGGNIDPTLSTDGTFRPKSWVLYGTNNLNDWSTVLDTVTNQPPSIYGDVHSISSPASYQYYKLSVTANNGGSGLKIGEWQLWGDA